LKPGVDDLVPVESEKRKQLSGSNQPLENPLLSSRRSFRWIPFCDRHARRRSRSRSLVDPHSVSDRSPWVFNLIGVLAAFGRNQNVSDFDPLEIAGEDEFDGNRSM
jgi:hypothetical protein